jgi:RNA polymerase sigma-70 factor (ECF subfamily)
MLTAASVRGKIMASSRLWMAGNEMFAKAAGCRQAEPMSAAVASSFAPDASQLAEDDLMLRARNGDRIAYAQLAARYQDRLFNAIYYLVGDADEATELTQETISRGLHKISDAAGAQSPYTWLFRTGLNLCIVAQRKSRRRRGFGPGPVLEALGRLEPDYRAVIVMHDVDALDYPQMAEVLDMPVVTVQSRLFRARLALWDELREKTQI